MDTVIQWLGWALAALFSGTLLLKGEIKFDVKEWRRDRRKRKEQNLSLLCPHVRPIKEDGKLGVRSTFVSPSGTLAWQCQMCGRWTHDQYEVDENLNSWANNPKGFIERNKEIEKLGKKLSR